MKTWEILLFWAVIIGFYLFTGLVALFTYLKEKRG